jgi:hypothetical protein
MVYGPYTAAHQSEVDEHAWAHVVFEVDPSPSAAGSEGRLEAARSLTSYLIVRVAEEEKV